MFFTIKLYLHLDICIDIYAVYSGGSSISTALVKHTDVYSKIFII